MTAPKKNNDRSKKTKGEGARDIGKLAECVLEALNHEIEKEEEPFETYAHSLKVRLLSDSNLLRERFVKGYDVLLEAVRADNQKN